MASRSLGSLTVDLVAKIGGFTAGMSKAEREADKSSRAIQARMKKLAKGIEATFQLAAAGAVASFAVIGAGVKNAINAADALGKMSQRTGISVEALSRLEVAASQSDTSLESLQKGLIALGRAQLEARKGTAEQVALFKALRISMEDLERLSPDQLLKKIADVFQNTADSPEKAALAVKAFSEAGAELIPLLNGGSEQLERFDRLSDELGNTMSQETALAAAEFNDQLDLVKVGINGVWRDTATGLLPTLNKLAGDLNDPQFREGFAAIVSGAVEATANVAGLVTELGNLTRWAGEEVAARINGPSRDDVVRLEQQRDRLQEELDGIVVDVPAMFNVLGLGRRDTLRAEIKETEALIAEHYATLEQMRSSAAQAAEEPSEEANAAGLDLDAWRKEAEARAAAAAAAAGARKAEAEAARQQAELERDAAQALRESQEASESFLQATENLRAELGGPMAQVQLEYIRREDELIRLAQLAGLSQEEMAQTLGLLEAARLKDVDAINEQIEAQKALKQAQEDAPLIRQMDELRNTTAGFFADLVMNGKDAIDRLQEYLLSLALENIGRQIAEGLFGDFGTTGGGKAGGWGAILGSLFEARAAGGPVFPGQAYLVGEEGPELIRPMGAGMVVPAAQTAAMAGGRGMQVTQNFQLPGRYDLRTQAQVAADALRVGRLATGRSTA